MLSKEILSLFGLFGTSWALVAIIIFSLVGIIFHILMGAAAFNDAFSLQQKRPLVFFGPTIWGLLVLVTGLVGLTIYWVMHHSTLRPPPSQDGQ